VYFILHFYEKNIFVLFFVNTKNLYYLCRVKYILIIMITLKGIDSRMIANNLTPYRPIHPGEILKDEIEYRGLSQRKLAAQMGVAYSVLNEVLNAKRPVTTEYAMLFEAALDVDAEPLIKMQVDYNLQTIKKDKTFAERLAEIRKAAAALW
jgi:addiction module HigA family antidote